MVAVGMSRDIDITVIKHAALFSSKCTGTKQFLQLDIHIVKYTDCIFFIFTVGVTNCLLSVIFSCNMVTCLYVIIITNIQMNLLC